MIIRFGKDANTGRHPGSMAKVVTALVAYDVIPPSEWSEPITIISSDMADGPEESVMGLQVGDVVTFEALLYGLFLPSGNDAARAIARCAGEIIRGSSGTVSQYLAAFVQAMNDKAAYLQMTESLFKESWGITAGTRMSPSDTARAMWAMSEIPDLLTIGSAQAHDVIVTGPNARTLSLANGFNPDGAVKFPEVIVCKNGYAWDGSENSGRCSVMLWETQWGSRRVSVVMAAESSIRRYLDLRSMLDSEIARSAQTQPAPDKTALLAALDDAAVLSEGDYTPDSWAVLAGAVATGQLVYDDPDATQQQVNNAATAINSAIDALVPVPDPDPQPDLPTEIGQPFGGGYYIGDITVADGGPDDGTYAVIAAPESAPEALQWRDSGAVGADGAVSLENGKGNTEQLMADADPSRFAAAWYCHHYSNGGYTDWYLPAYRELLLFQSARHLIPPVSWGGLFWTSTENSVAPYSASAVSLNSSYVSMYEKDTLQGVRPVRRIRKS